MKGNLIQQSSLALVLRALGAVCAYLTVVGLGRALAPGDFGYMAASLSMALIMSALVGLGYPTAMLRMMGEAQGQRHGGRAALTRALDQCLKSSGAVVMLSLSVAWITWDSAPRLGHLALGLMLVPGFVMTDLHGAVLRSADRVIAALAPRDILWRLGVIAMGFGVGQTFVPGAQFTVLLGMGVVWLAVIAVVQGRSAWRGIPPADGTAVTPGIDAAVVHRIWATNVAGMGFRNLDVIWIALLLSPAEAGLYFAASKTASLTVFALNAVNTVIAPRLAAMNRAGDRDGLARELRLGAAMAFAPAAAGGGLILLIGPQILNLFGEGGSAYMPVLIILTGAQVISGLCACAGTLLNMTGHEDAHMRTSLGWLVFGVIAMGLSTALGGAIGVAIATGVTLAGHDLSLWWAARQRTGYDSSILAWRPFHKWNLGHD